MAKENLIELIHRIMEVDAVPDLPTLLSTLRAVDPYDRARLLKTNDYFGTLLHRLSAHGFDEAFKCVLSTVHRRWLVSLLTMTDRLGYTALHRAVCKGSNSIVRHMLSPMTYEEREGLLQLQEFSGRTALHRAVLDQHTEIIKTILNFLQPHQRLSLLKVEDNYNKSCIEIGLSSTSDDIRACLSRYQAMSELPRQQLTCQEFSGHSGERSKRMMYDSSEEGCRKPLDKLTSNRRGGMLFQDIFITANQQKKSPRDNLMHMLREYMQRKITLTAAELKTAIIDLPIYDRLRLLRYHNSTGTVLHMAALGEQTDIILCVISALKSDQLYSLIKLQNDEGRTVLHELSSAFKEHEKVFSRVLLSMPSSEERDIVLGIQDVKGNTTLHCAANRDHSSIAKVILLNCTRLQCVRNGDGLTAMDVALAHNFEDTVKCFQELGTKHSTDDVSGEYDDVTSCDQDSTSTSRPVEVYSRTLVVPHTKPSHQSYKVPKCSPDTLLVSTLESMKLYITAFTEGTADGNIVHLPDVTTLRHQLLLVQSKTRLTILKKHDQTGTILHCLATHGVLDIIDCILYSVHSDHVFSLLNIRDQCGNTMLHQAAYNGHTGILNMVVDVVASLEELFILLSAKDPSDLNPVEYSFLYWGFSLRDVGEEFIQSLTATSADISKRPKESSQGTQSSGQESHDDVESVPEAKLIQVPHTTTSAGGLYQHLAQVIREQQDEVLVSICEKMADQVKCIIPCVIQREPLSTNQLQILSPLSDSYILPYKQTRTRRYALVCYTAENREGSQREASYLSQSLEMAGFTVVKLQWAGFTEFHADILRHVKSVSDRCSLLLVSIMAHGLQGVICGADGSSGSINTILDDVICSLPSFIPKVFIIQACQTGSPPNSARLLSDSSVHNVLHGSSVRNVIREPGITLRQPNTALLLSTVTGGRAVRGFYPYSIADYLSQADGHVDLLGMHRAAVSLMKQHPDYSKCLQVPEYRDTLDRFLILPPSLTHKPCCKECEQASA